MQYTSFKPEIANSVQGHKQGCLPFGTSQKFSTSKVKSAAISSSLFLLISKLFVAVSVNICGSTSF